MKPLFIVGSPRSGTTGLADYLNEHEEILLCRERYKYGPRNVTPDLFTFERILDYGERETNISREYHANLLANKDPAKLKWVGDKYPSYIRRLRRVSKDSPGARFIVLYRPIEEVAESFQARADDPRDHWPSDNGFELGVQLWNSALKYARNFVENTRNPNVLIVSYHDFFRQNEPCVQLISRFLDVEFGESIRQRWRVMSRGFENQSRRKEALNEEQAAFIREIKDHVAEEWILSFMEKQRNEPESISSPRPDMEREQARLVSQLREARQELRKLKRRNERLTARVDSLKGRVERLNLQIRDVKNSKTWRLSQRLGIVKSKALDGLASVIPAKENARPEDAKPNLDDYDFLDFGASKGDSIRFGMRRLGGTRGLGIDIDPKKVETMRSKGLDCVEADVAHLDFPADSVRFVVMSHFLEHLPDLTTVERSIESAARVASDFLFIQGPYFDADEFLSERGLKFYWSDWHGHPCHLTTSQLRDILLKLGLNDHVMMVCDPVTDSADPAVHPLASPIDQHDYDPEAHPEKPFVEFPQPLYRSIMCCVRLGPVEDWESILRVRKGCRRLDAGPEKKEPSRPRIPSPVAKTPADGVASTATSGTKKYLDEMTKRMLLKRRWAYLRYLHTREALVLAKDVESVLVVGAGHGYAEVALALEFPEKRFHLTDIESERTPNYHNAQNLVDRWNLKNVTFGVQNILVPERGRHDLVASVEVLEHIEDDTLAAAEMRAAANRYVFALIPFADKTTNADEAMRARVFESHEHFRVGYDEEDLRKLFPGIVALRGCYWREHGGAHRKHLYDMTNEEVNASLAELREEAQHDIVDGVPEVYPEAQGIWMLAEV